MLHKEENLWLDFDLFFSERLQECSETWSLSRNFQTKLESSWELFCLYGFPKDWQKTKSKSKRRFTLGWSPYLPGMWLGSCKRSLYSLRSHNLSIQLHGKKWMWQFLWGLLLNQGLAFPQVHLQPECHLPRLHISIFPGLSSYIFRIRLHWLPQPYFYSHKTDVINWILNM